MAKNCSVEIVNDSRRIQADLPVCASAGYLKAAAETYGWFVASDFVLPFYTLNRMFARHLVFTTGPIRKTAQTSIKQEKAFLTEVVVLCRRMGIDFIRQPKTTALFNTYPDGAIHIQWGCYRADLLQDEKLLFSRFSTNRRRVIRKAERDHVRILDGPEHITECHELIQWTLTRQNCPGIKLAQLMRYQENLPRNVSFYLAKHNRRNLACAVLVHDRTTAYYIHGGSCTKPHHGAAALLHWTAMRDMKNKGLTTYNFVGGRIHPVKGSKPESIQIFKSRFGTTFTKGYLWKYPLTPWKYGLSQGIRRITGLAKGPHYGEDIIDNEIRTGHMEKSKLINNTASI